VLCSTRRRCGSTPSRSRSNRGGTTRGWCQIPQPRKPSARAGDRHRSSVLLRALTTPGQGFVYCPAGQRRNERGEGPSSSMASSFWRSDETLQPVGRTLRDKFSAGELDKSGARAERVRRAPSRVTPGKSCLEQGPRGRPICRRRAPSHARPTRRRSRAHHRHTAMQFGRGGRERSDHEKMGATGRHGIVSNPKAGEILRWRRWIVRPTGRGALRARTNQA